MNLTRLVSLTGQVKPTHVNRNPLIFFHFRSRSAALDLACARIADIFGMNDSRIRAVLIEELNSALEQVEEEVRVDKQIRLIISFRFYINSP